MNPSFAQIRQTLYAAMLLSVLSTPVLAQDAALELATAQQAVDRAVQADADQYSPELLAQARQGLEQAQRAAQDRRERKQAPAIALRAAADADLARAQSEEAVANSELRQREAEVAQLQRSLASGEGR